MGLIYIIRHGQASFGASDYDRLSPPGMNQARLLGAYFKDTGVEFHRVFSGTLKRQIDTARLALGQMKAGADPGVPVQMKEFNEMDVSEIIRHLESEMIRDDPEIRRDLDLQETDVDAFYRVIEQAVVKTDQVGPNHPSALCLDRFVQQVSRGLSALAEAHTDGQNTAVFTSAGTISIILALVLELTKATAMHLCRRIYNSSVSVFARENDRLHLVAFNTAAHLDREKDPGLLTII